jgi:hypothetical protein
MVVFRVRFRLVKIKAQRLGMHREKLTGAGLYRRRGRDTSREFGQHSPEKLGFKGE